MSAEEARRQLAERLAQAKARLRRVRALLELGQADQLDRVSEDIMRIKKEGGALSKDTIDRFAALVVSAT